jgi:hypothetical protein
MEIDGIQGNIDKVFTRLSQGVYNFVFQVFTMCVYKCSYDAFLNVVTRLLFFCARCLRGFCNVFRKVFTCLLQVVYKDLTGCLQRSHKVFTFVLQGFRNVFTIFYKAFRRRSERF